MIDGKVTLCVVIAASVLSMMVFDPLALEKASGRLPALATFVCTVLAYWAFRHFRGDALAAKHFSLLALCLFCPAATAVWTLADSERSVEAGSTAVIVWKVVYTVLCWIASWYSSKRLKYYVYTSSRPKNKSDGWEILDALLAGVFASTFLLANWVPQLPWYHKLWMTPVAFVTGVVVLILVKEGGRDALNHTL